MWLVDTVLDSVDIEHFYCRKVSKSAALESLASLGDNPSLELSSPVAQALKFSPGRLKLSRTLLLEAQSRSQSTEPASSFSLCTLVWLPP